MTEELKSKLDQMTESELREVIDNSEDYQEDVLIYAKQLLHIEDTPKQENSNNDIKEVAKERNEKTSTKTLVICCSIIIVIIFSVVFGITYYNNAKLQEQTAITRINSVCDEINRLGKDIEPSQLYSYNSKIDELELLVNNNHLDDIYVKKYTEAKNYIEDLKLYKEICNALNGNDKSAWLKIQTSINNLKTEQIRAAIDDDTIRNIENIAYLNIVYNSLKHLEENVIKQQGFESGNTGITDSYCFSILDNNNNYLMGIPDAGKTEVHTDSFGIITNGSSGFFDSYYNHISGFNYISNKVVKETVSKGDSVGFAVEYVDNTLTDMVSHISWDFSVEATYDNGVLKITLKTDDGTEEIRISELTNKKLFTLR